MSGAQHTPGPDDTSTEARNEEACRAAALKHGLTREQADACDDCEHRCPTCPWSRSAPIVEVGQARRAMEDFTVADFRASKVPPGTRLFAVTDPERIVQCVNAHDGLVEALREVLDARKDLEAAAHVGYKPGEWDAREQAIRAAQERVRAAEAKGRAAIAKATGSQP